jgi:lipoate-protein ligase A
LPRNVIIDHLIAFFRDRYGLTDDTLTLDELAEAERRVTERFSTPEWIYFLP